MAEGSSDKDNMMNSMLLCPKCQLMFDEDEKIPKMLRCQHAVCLRCLKEALSTTTNHSLNCPLCHDVQDWDPQSVSPLDEFPDYHMLKQLCTHALFINSCASGTKSPDHGTSTSNDVRALKATLAQAKTLVRAAELEVKEAEREEESWRSKLQEAEKKVRTSRSRLQVLITKSKVAELNLDLAKAVHDLGVAESSAKRFKVTVEERNTSPNGTESEGGCNNITIKTEPLGFDETIIIKQEPMDGTETQEASSKQTPQKTSHVKKHRKKAAKPDQDLRPVLVVTSSSTTTSKEQQESNDTNKSVPVSSQNQPTTSSTTNTSSTQSTPPASVAVENTTISSTSALVGASVFRSSLGGVSSLPRMGSSPHTSSSTSARPNVIPPPHTSSIPTYLKHPYAAQAHLGTPIQRQQFVRIIPQQQPHFINVSHVPRQVFVPRYFINNGRWQF